MLCVILLYGLKLAIWVFMGQQRQIAKRDSWKLFDQIASTYDLLNRLISFGADGFWRAKMVGKIVSRPKIQALDLATGTADVALLLAQREDVQRVEGVDLSEQMLALGRKKVEQGGFTKKVSLTVGDGVSLDYSDGSFDLVTLAFGIRNFDNVTGALSSIHRVLAPGGQVVVMEFGLPRNSLIKFVYLFYFRRILPLVGRLVSRHPFAYSYLNRTVESFPYGENFLSLLKRAGFKELRAHPLCFGVAYIYTGSRP